MATQWREAWKEMHVKKNKLFVLLTLAVASFVLLTGFKGGGHHGGRDGHGFFGKKMERVLDEIDATPEQRAQIEAIRNRLVEQKKAQRQQGDREQMKQEMLSFWTEAQPSQQEMRARIDQRIERQRQNAYAMADAMIEVHRVLTPEQRAEVAQLIEQHAAKMKDRKGEKRERKGGAPAEAR